MATGAKARLWRECEPGRDQRNGKNAEFVTGQTLHVNEGSYLA